jgi:hypothetical protein
MRVHRVLAVGVVLLFLVGLGFGQDKGRAQHFSGQSPLQTIAVCNCGDFEVWENWVDFFHGTVVYDKDGQQVRQVMNTSFGKTNTYYNASNPGLFLNGSPGEGQNFRFEFKDGVLYMSGVLNKIVIPGYGHILMETGFVAFKIETGEILANRGHNQYLTDRDFEALCGFLRPKP